MKTMNGDGKFRIEQPVSKQIMIIVLGAALILLAPLLAMQFTDEVAWNLFDFAVAGALLVGTGVIYVLSARMVSNARYRIVLGVALAVALFLVWAELAVGIFGTPFAGT
jgi:hypothetical protein